MDKIKNGLIIDENGNKNWYKNNVHHRVDGPAIETMDGFKYWLQEGKFHRDTIDASTGEVQPAKEYPDGSKEWFFQGQCHREKGPAVEHSNGTQIWYHYGIQHREDGPAFICLNAQRKTEEQWIINGKKLSEKEAKEQVNILKEQRLLQSVLSIEPLQNKKLKI